MKVNSLIVEDNFIDRRLLQRFLGDYGLCDVAINGKEALDAFFLAHKEGNPYNLICLDIIMPEMDGRQVLQAIRKEEESMGITGLHRANIIMTTGVEDSKTILGSFWTGCEGYLHKPISKSKLVELIKLIGLAE